MINKIGIFGASGLIGYNLFKFFKKKNINVTGTYCNNFKENLIHFDILKDDFEIFSNCDVLIIAGAISKLDDCKNHEVIARKINVEKTIELIKFCTSNNIKPIFLSSDQVFDGKKGNYSENNLPNPINNYGKMKLEVENYITKNLTEYLILRLSKTYSKNREDAGIYNEIVNKLQNNEIVYAATDLIFNPTVIEFVINKIDYLINSNICGLYHLAEQNILNRFDLSIKFAKEKNLNFKLIQAVKMTEVKLKEKRALNSSLNVEKLNKDIK